MSLLKEMKNYARYVFKEFQIVLLLTAVMEDFAKIVLKYFYKSN